jgi:hypothetical protein
VNKHTLRLKMGFVYNMNNTSIEYESDHVIVHLFCLFQLVSLTIVLISILGHVHSVNPDASIRARFGITYTWKWG